MSWDVMGFHNMNVQIYCLDYFNRADAFDALLDLFRVAQVTLKVQARLSFVFFFSPFCLYAREMYWTMKAW